MRAALPFKNNSDATLVLPLSSAETATGEGDVGAISVFWKWEEDKSA